MNKPDRTTKAGETYLELRKLARQTSRPTDELLQLYALEGFLKRLTLSQHESRLILKGGVLLAAYDVRRPTRDIDFSATAISSETTDIKHTITDIAKIKDDDGLDLDTTNITVETIREHETYNGFRIKLTGKLSTAKVFFHIDINIGDPIHPPADHVLLPRLLGGEPIRLKAYSIEMILAEKLVTAIQRGTVNTRWRDFLDIANLSEQPIDDQVLVEAIARVAAHRNTILRQLATILENYGQIAQPKWTAWRRKQHLSNATPESFNEVIDQIIIRYDPLIAAAGK